MNFVVQTVASLNTPNYRNPWCERSLHKTFGSGFIFLFENRKYFVTCAHTVQDSLFVECFMPYTGVKFISKIKQISDTLDIATLELTDYLESEQDNAITDYCLTVSLNETVYINGFSPEDVSKHSIMTHISGVIESTFFSGLKNLVYKSDIRVPSGYSGAAVVNSSGKLVGICFSKCKKDGSNINESTLIIPVFLLIQHIKLNGARLCDFSIPDINNVEIIDGKKIKVNRIDFGGQKLPIYYYPRTLLPGQSMVVKYKNNDGEIIMPYQAIKKSPIPYTSSDITKEYFILGGLIFLPLNGFILRKYKITVKNMENVEQIIVLSGIIPTPLSIGCDHQKLVVFKVDNAVPKNLKNFEQLLSEGDGNHTIYFSNGFKKEINYAKYVSVSENYVRKFIKADYLKIND